MLILTCDGLPDLDLEDPESGVLCTKLDMGWPDPRVDSTPVPKRSGNIDHTRWYGDRAVSLDLSITDGTIGRRVDVLGRLAPFLHPARRPTLRYVDDMHGGGSMVRTVTLAPRKLSAGREGTRSTAAQAQFVAPLGVAVADQVISFDVRPLSDAPSGRAYSLAYPRTYPTGHSTAPRTLPIIGDSQPIIVARVFGECTAPKVTAEQNGETWTVVETLSSVTIPTGSFLEIDMTAHTVLLNGSAGASRFEWISHATSTWRLPMPGTATVRFSCASAQPDAVLRIDGWPTYFL